MPSNTVRAATEGLPKISSTHHASALSFMSTKKQRGTGIDYWLVASTGRYGEDCEAGRALAAEYLAYIGEQPTVGNASLLTCIVRDMIDQAKAGSGWSGVHAGFLRQINEYAMAAARVIHAGSKGGAA